MKYLLIILFLFCIEACNNNQNHKPVNATPAKDTVIKHDTIYINNENNWQEGFNLSHDPELDSVWGKPVKFYIDNAKCSPIAIDFYRGQFKPTDNNTTAALLELVTTDDDNLRPFYRWCLNKTILIQDGALGEYTGVPAREYAEKFPKEFFGYMDFDTTKSKYDDWVSSIAYSGFYVADDYRKPAEIRTRLVKKMKQQCKNCNALMNKRIDKFAMDCFSDTLK